MTAANELIRRAVTVDPTRRPAENAPRARSARAADEPGAALPAQRRRSSSAESIVFALADGFAYAIDGRPVLPSGMLRSVWPRRSCRSRHGRGDRASPSTPVMTSWSASMPGTEHSIWRLALGERARRSSAGAGQPALPGAPQRQDARDRTRFGRASIDRQPGPSARSDAGHDESGQHLYVLGRQDCLFVLARDPLSCVGSRLSGPPGRLDPLCPARLGRFLVIAENDSLADSRWHILVVDEDGVKVKPVQEVEVSGWTWQTPATSGPIVWGDRRQGGLRGVLGGRLREQGAVSLGGPAHGRRHVVGAGLRAGAVGSGAVGRVGTFRAFCARRRARSRSSPRRRSRSPGPRRLPFRPRAGSWS